MQKYGPKYNFDKLVKALFERKRFFYFFYFKGIVSYPGGRRLSSSPPIHDTMTMLLSIEEWLIPESARGVAHT